MPKKLRDIKEEQNVINEEANIINEEPVIIFPVINMEEFFTAMGRNAFNAELDGLSSISKD